MHVRRTDALVTVHAPAKINLFLEVLARRDDGFHEIETLMTAVSFGDTLLFAPQDASAVEFECRWGCGIAARQTANCADRGADVSDVLSGPDNLAWRAVELLRQKAGVKRGARMLLVKRTPAAAGLGGASSDAAAALVAANEGWKLNWLRERLAELAGELGSDVPFFLSGGTAICRGRGEQIEPLPSPRLHLVVVRPPVGLSTPAVYRACRPAETPTSIGPLMAALAKGNAAAAGNALRNRLQTPAQALTDWIARLADEFARLDTLGHQMSGSGSSYFGLARSARHARRMAARLSARNLGVVFAAATTST